MLESVGINLLQYSMTNGFKLKMRGHKLRNGMYGQGMLKQKGIEEWGVKQGVHVCAIRKVQENQEEIQWNTLLSSPC
jgi:hypothetical protein